MVKRSSSSPLPLVYVQRQFSLYAGKRRLGTDNLARQVAKLGADVGQLGRVAHAEELAGAGRMIVNLPLFQVFITI